MNIEKQTICLLCISCLHTVSSATSVWAEDWPQWLGARRDSVWRETGLVDSFPATGLKQVWRREIAYGYAGPAVANGRVYVVDFVTDEVPAPKADRRDKLVGRERVLCLKADSGDLLWEHSYSCTYNISFPYGPRATPTVDEDRVYTLGAEGTLLCLQVSDGSVVWSKELTKEYDCETPTWGFSGHPLVDGDRLICLVGGNGSVAVALDKRTGKEIWRALSAREPGYCAPTIIEYGSTRQLLIWHPESLNSLNPRTGELYWKEELKPDWAMSVAVPRQDGQFLFVGAIVDKSMLLKLSAERPTAEWIWGGRKGRGLGPVFSTPLVQNGHMFGIDKDGELRCVRLDETGKQIWHTYAATTGERAKDNASAFLVRQADRFFIFNDQGVLILARLSPDPKIAYQEISREKLLEPTSLAYGRKVLWSHPAFAQKCIFARNDREIVCVSLAKD